MTASCVETAVRGLLRPKAVTAERAESPAAMSEVLRDSAASAGPGLLDAAMNRYADGDDSAFREVFAGLAPRLQAFLRRLGGSDDLANDLTQETLLRMHRARGSFARGTSVLPWAYAIARNCFVSHARSAKSKAAKKGVDITEHDVAAGLDASAEEAASARQSAVIVERTLAQMSAANREAFVLIRFEGQSMAAAAEILGTTEGAVKLRAFRAYERLREALRHAEHEPRSGRVRTK